MKSAYNSVQMINYIVEFKLILAGGLACRRAGLPGWHAKLAWCAAFVVLAGLRAGSS